MKQFEDIQILKSFSDKQFWENFRACNFLAIWLRMLFLDNVDKQLILECSFAKYHPVLLTNPWRFFLGHYVYVYLLSLTTERLVSREDIALEKSLRPKMSPTEKKDNHTIGEYIIATIKMPLMGRKCAIISCWKGGPVEIELVSFLNICKKFRGNHTVHQIIFNLPICIFIYLSIYPPDTFKLYIYLSFYLSTWYVQAVYLSIFLSIHLIP